MKKMKIALYISTYVFLHSNVVLFESDVLYCTGIVYTSEVSGMSVSGGTAVWRPVTVIIEP